MSKSFLQLQCFTQGHHLSFFLHYVFPDDEHHGSLPKAEKSTVTTGGSVMIRFATCGLQGEYVGLVSEPVSICGVDVSAPQQFRGQRRSTLDEMLESLGSCFTPNEVQSFPHRLQPYSHCHLSSLHRWASKQVELPITWATSLLEWPLLLAIA